MTAVQPTFPSLLGKTGDFPVTVSKGARAGRCQSSFFEQFPAEQGKAPYISSSLNLMASSARHTAQNFAKRPSMLTVALSRAPPQRPQQRHSPTHQPMPKSDPLKEESSCRPCQDLPVMRRTARVMPRRMHTSCQQTASMTHLQHHQEVGASASMSRPPAACNPGRSEVSRRGVPSCRPAQAPPADQGRTITSWAGKPSLGL